MLFANGSVRFAISETLIGAEALSGRKPQIDGKSKRKRDQYIYTIGLLGPGRRSSEFGSVYFGLGTDGIHINMILYALGKGKKTLCGYF